MDSLQIEETLNSSDEAVKSILSTILNMNMWNENTEKNIIAAINQLLVALRTRSQGLEFLNLIINNCSSKIILENGITWISYCLVKYPSESLKELKLSTVGRIIDNCHEESDFSRKFVSEYISKVLEACLPPHNNTYEYQAALVTLTVCMKYYGSWFGPHKLRIENFVTGLFENPSEETIENAAEAFHYLQQVGAAGKDCINHKTNFNTNFHKLCASVQQLLDKFLENEIEIDQTERTNQAMFEFTDLPHHTQKMLDTTARRIRNCITFLIKMLLKGFPAEKEIVPMEVLDLIRRGTALHRCVSTGSGHSLEDFQFSALLNKIQMKLLQLLHVFIIWLHGNALPFSFIITKILTDCLNKTQSCQCFKTDSLYQEMVYTTLGCWVRLSKGAVHSHFQTQLVKCILNDIIPEKINISLSLPGDMHRSKSRKAMQKAVQEKIIFSAQGNSLKEKTNMEISNKENNCLLALDTLKHLLISTLLKISPEIQKELCATIINTLVDIQTSKSSHPYTNGECESKLYEVLVAFYEQDTLKTLPPLGLAIDVLNRGMNSRNRTIALTCENGLNMMEKICQPVCSSLFMSKDNNKMESLSFTNDKYEHTEKSEDDERFIRENEVNLDRLDISESRDTTIEKFELSCKDTESVVSKEVSNGPKETLTREPSVHIIDVQIIRCNSKVQGENDMVTTKECDSRVSEVEGDENEASAVCLKTEVLSQQCMDMQEQDTVEQPAENAEPPLKKIRTEMSYELKNEPKSENLEDDIFTEEISAESIKIEASSAENVPDELENEFSDDFVDVVKDY